MTWPILAAAAASAAAGIYAANKSASAQSGAAEDAAQVTWDMYMQGREDLAPWREAGAWALGTPSGPAPEVQDYTDQVTGLQNELQRMYSGATNDEAYEADLAKWEQDHQTWNVNEYGYQYPKPNQGDPKYSTIDYAAIDAKEQELNALIAQGAPEGERTPGTGLLGMIEAGPGEFEESPGYQFTLQEGLNAQQNALSAMGKNRSGQHIKAATQYAEGLASTEYDNFLNRWYKSLTPYQSVAGLGQTSAEQTASLGAGAAANIGNAQIAGGQAQAGGYINSANALTGAITGGANQLLYYNALRNLQPQQLPPAGPGYGYGTGGYGQSAGYR